MKKKCSVEGCDKVAVAKGYCGAHYARFKKSGYAESRFYKSCQVNGCDKPHYSKGYCAIHYNQMRRTTNVKGLCSVDECSRPAATKGYCQSHYDKLRRRGTTDAHPKYTKKLCAVEGCERPHLAKGYCSLHWERMNKHGRLDVLIKRKRKVRALTEEEQTILLGRINKPMKGIKSNYARLSIGKRGNNVEKRRHVLLAEKALGHSLPQGAAVHHLDGNSLNNTPQNLLVCPNHAYHMLIEARTRAYEACGHADWAKCQYCKQYDDPKNMYIRPNRKGHPRGWHHPCEAKASRDKRVAQKKL